MLIERRSLVSGVLRTLDLPITEDQIEMWEGGASVQDAFPNLTPSQREFMLTGITDDEWEDTFAPEAEDWLPENDEPAF